MRTETLDAEKLELPGVSLGGLRSNTKVKRLNSYPGARPYPDYIGRCRLTL